VKTDSKDSNTSAHNQTFEEERKTTVKLQDAERDLYIVRETRTCKERERNV